MCNLREKMFVLDILFTENSDHQNRTVTVCKASNNDTKQLQQIKKRIVLAISAIAQ